MNAYPRETVEFVAITVADGTTPITSYDVQITDYNARPVPNAWTANVALDGRHGAMLTGRPAGLYRVWVRITGNPETPVVDCGYLSVT